MEKVGSPASRAQARLFSRLGELRGRYLFATSVESGCDIPGLSRMISRAHGVSAARRKSERSATSRTLKELVGALRTLSARVEAFNGVPVAEWKRKVRAADSVKEPLGRARVAARRISYFPEFRLLVPVLDSWRKDAGSTGRFYQKLGRLLDADDHEGVSALDIRGLDRGGRAYRDPAVEDHLEQLDRLKVGLLLGKGDDPSGTYARMLLMEGGGWTPPTGGGAGSEGADAGSARALRVIVGAFRGMLLTMLAIAYLPLLILALAGAAGVEASGSGMLSLILTIQLILSFAIPLSFLLWTLSGTGFDMRSAQLFDSRVLWASVAATVVLALVGPLQRYLIGMGDALAVMLILGCVIIAVAGLRLAGDDVKGDDGPGPALTRYGLAHLVSLPMATLVVLLTSGYHMGGAAGGDALLGIASMIELDIGGSAIGVYAPLILILSFLISAVGSLVSALANMSGKRLR
jgi:hypothetical protein